MTTTAARVELLTAEVRVLMVGSRQVTMSVYEQLDAVAPDQIEPFGRVRRRAHCREPYYGQRPSAFCPGDCIDVVGSSWDGALVRSCLDRDQREADADDRMRLRAWRDLPLIVLAGLR